MRVAGPHGEDVSAPTSTPARAIKKKPFKRRIFYAALVVLVAAALCVVTLLCVRSLQEHLDVGAVSAPVIALNADGPGAAQRAFTATLSYADIASVEGVPSTSEVSWDDDWFFRDPTVYNHELATTCAVLSAIANAESSYYQAGTDAPAYMEEALAELGFDSVSTSSYRYRSEVIDEVLDAVTARSDVVAYSLATKRVHASDGREKTLLLVSARGSYGSEWISNVNLGDARTFEEETIDHQGFAKAAQSLIDDLAARIDELAVAGEDVALLFCGHSRGGAIANLAAARADDRAQGLHALAPRDAIYAYTFATPRVTTFDGTDEATYDNIFNVLNPSDLVPRFPLEAWGYTRYGTDVWLPAVDDAGFDEAHARMRACYLEDIGAPSPGDPADKYAVDELEEKLARDIPDVAEIVSLRSLWSIATGLLRDIDVMRVLCSHYPSTYIAWMQAVEPGELAFEE